MFDDFAGVGLGNVFDSSDLSHQRPGLGGGFVAPQPAQNAAPTDTAPAATAPSTAPPAQTPVIDRSRFAAEIKSNPTLKQKIMAIAAGENLNPTANQAVLETMMNRATIHGTSLAEQARLHKSSGINENGYYAGYNPKALDRPKISSMIEGNLDKVLAGSNVSNYATDNASGSFADKQRSTGKFIYRSSYGGETFFSPGTASGAGTAKAYDKWVKNLGNPDAAQPTAVAGNTNRVSDQEYRDAFPNAPRINTDKGSITPGPPSSAVASAGSPGGLEGFTPGLAGKRPFFNPFGGVKAPEITVMPLTRGPVARAPQIVDPNSGAVIAEDPLPMNWQA